MEVTGDRDAPVLYKKPSEFSALLAIATNRSSRLVFILSTGALRKIGEEEGTGELQERGDDKGDEWAGDTVDGVAELPFNNKLLGT